MYGGLLKLQYHSAFSSTLVSAYCEWTSDWNWELKSWGTLTSDILWSHLHWLRQFGKAAWIVVGLACYLAASAILNHILLLTTTIIAVVIVNTTVRSL